MKKAFVNRDCELVVMPRIILLYNTRFGGESTCPMSTAIKINCHWGECVHQMFAMSHPSIFVHSLLLFVFIDIKNKSEDSWAVVCVHKRDCYQRQNQYKKKLEKNLMRINIFRVSKWPGFWLTDFSEKLEYPGCCTDDWIFISFDVSICKLQVRIC